MNGTTSAKVGCSAAAAAPSSANGRRPGSSDSSSRNTATARVENTSVDVRWYPNGLVPDTISFAFSSQIFTGRR